MKAPYTDLSILADKFNQLYGSFIDGQLDRYNNLFANFKSAFKVESAYVASSSGRVEVCGNHTDHNGGKVVSCTISLDTLAMFLPNDENVIRVKSEGYDDIIIDLNGENNERIGTSSALVRGVVVGLMERGYKVGGFNACLTSNVIGGAGISSSASFEVLMCEILNFLYNDSKIDCETKAMVSQFSENKYFGKPCGLLDQTAISYGGLNKLDFSDKKSIKVEKIDGDLSNVTLVLLNTGGSHADLTDEYASIPSEMFSVANALGASRLIDITKENFITSLPLLFNKVCDRAILRAFHFYEENERVDTLVKAIINGDITTFFDCLNGSGRSSLSKLQNCYVAGSVEQPIVKVLAVCGIYNPDGACRVHGGGFAGSVLNVIKTSNATTFIEKMNNLFGKENVIPLSVRNVGAIVL